MPKIPKLPRLIQTFITDAAKITGTYDPRRNLSRFEEHLTQDEYDTVEGFLRWLHENGRAFGWGNADEVYAEYLKATGAKAIPGTVEHLTDQEEARRGALLAEILMLKKQGNGRYNTTWGDKTPWGLYLTVKRIIEEGE